jgi:hypothetical protein
VIRGRAPVFLVSVCMRSIPTKRLKKKLDCFLVDFYFSRVFTVKRT